MTPSHPHRPSHVKGKLETKKVKAIVHAEVLKAASVREIKTMGAEGVMKIVSGK